jgi:hypothetical protein
VSNPPNKLPDKLWQLLELAIKSAKELKKSGYTLNMRTWYFKSEMKCTVCMAGAVMVKALGVKESGLKTPSLFDLDTDNKLMAIDCLRKGLVNDALTHIGQPYISLWRLDPKVMMRVVDKCEQPWHNHWSAHRALLGELKRLDL